MWFTNAEIFWLIFGGVTCLVSILLWVLATTFKKVFHSDWREVMPITTFILVALYILAAIACFLDRFNDWLNSIRF